mmetsp:Transcript_24008/g.77239  ORF Transcript_24008/g.77239 Transcript_24008/m.77239 type:complete len:1199 (+) Transcript_24008:528-4124(+)
MVLQFPGTIPATFVAIVYRRALDSPGTVVERTAIDRFLDGLRGVHSAARREQAGLIVMGDFNVYGVRTPDQGPHHRFPRPDPVPAEGRHGLASIFEAFLVGEPRDDGQGFHGFSALHNDAWTRRPVGAQTGCDRQLDYALGDDRAAPHVTFGAVGDVLGGPYRHLHTDHRPICVETRLAVRARAAAVGCPPARRMKRLVRWWDVDPTTRSAFGATLAGLVSDGRFDLRGRNDVAFCQPWASTGRSATRAAATLIQLVHRAEDATIGSSRVDSMRRTTPQRAPWWSPTLEHYHRIFAQRRLTAARASHQRPSRTTPPNAAERAAVAAMDEAQRALDEAIITAQLTYAAGARLFADESTSNHAARLHDMFRRLTGGGGRASTHVFTAVYDDSGAVVTGAAVCPALVRWTARFHEVNPISLDFDVAECRAREREFGHWRRHRQGPECLDSRRWASRHQHWGDFEATVDAALASGTWATDRFSDGAWSRYLAHDVLPAAIEAAVRLGKTRTTPCPADNVTYAALKAAGPEFHAMMADFLASVLESGDVPASWQEGWTTYLFKKGNTLDPKSFRGIVVTSVFTKTCERVFLTRLMRWIHFRGLVPIDQATTHPYIDVRAQVQLLLDAPALRTSQGHQTHVLAVDIASAYPSVDRLFLWTQLHRLGLRGAGLRFLVNLLDANAVRLGGLPDGCFSERVERGTGIPEGFVLSPVLFVLFFAPLSAFLAARGRGIRLGEGGAHQITAPLLTDDVALTAPTAAALQVLFEAFLQFCYKRRLRVNASKCHYVVLGATSGNPPLVDQLPLVFQPAPGRQATHYVFPRERQLRYLGWQLAAGGTMVATVTAARTKAKRIRGGARDAMPYLRQLPRSALLQVYGAKTQSTLEWSAAIWPIHGGVVMWKQLQRDDAADHRLLLLSRGKPYPCDDGLCFLLNVLPLRLRVARQTARYALTFVNVLACDERRRVLVDEIVDAGGTAYSRSSCRRIYETLETLGLAVPHWSVPRATWRRRVSAKLRDAVHRDLHRHASLTLLCLVRPSVKWRKRWILRRRPGDAESELLAGILCDRWLLVPDVRAQTSEAQPGVCDLCGAAHPGADLATTLFVCPSLAAARLSWFAHGRAVAGAAGCLPWWTSSCESGPPTTRRVAAAIFGLGARAPGLRRTLLPDALCQAFIGALTPWLAANDALIDALCRRHHSGPQPTSPLV